MTNDIKSWIFGRLTHEELRDLAYEFGRQYPIETMRGAKDAQAARGVLVTPDMIVNEVSDAYHVQTKFIYGQARDKRSTEARKTAAHIMRHGLDLSLDEIGSILGGRDHTTVLYYLQTLNDESDSFTRALDVLTAMGLSYA